MRDGLLCDAGARHRYHRTRCPGCYGTTVHHASIPRTECCPSIRLIVDLELALTLTLDLPIRLPLISVNIVLIHILRPAHKPALAAGLGVLTLGLVLTVQTAYVFGQLPGTPVFYQQFASHLAWTTGNAGYVALQQCSRTACTLSRQPASGLDSDEFLSMRRSAA